MLISMTRAVAAGSILRRCLATLFLSLHKVAVQCAMQAIANMAAQGATIIHNFTVPDFKMFFNGTETVSHSWHTNV